ncbi:hypothetical protein GCM10011349_23830 [Novosphingobium indicum]|uniref:Uncharacterized protein n=1 Tax=Novosphingobium indicum TaxID=462949 RepID=A0ABQ2JQ76_9SPHN|nr:hypothetical protein GCM10011349_23830 [Novosphingobium indicum]
MQRDHVKLGPFELRPNDDVLVLDPDAAGESTLEYDSDDVQRIERMFEFIDDTEGLCGLTEWLNQSGYQELDIIDFLTLPEYALAREKAWNEVEGLQE